MPESIKKNFFQPISSWMFDNDTRIIESMDNFYLLAIVTGLLGTSAFFYKNYCLTNNLPVPWFIKYLVFYLVTVVVGILEVVVVAEMVEEVANDHLW